MFLFILIALFLSSSAEVNPCAPTWHYFNKTGCCYKTTSDIGTWFEGSGMCAKMQPGSQLASLGSHDESKFVAAKHRLGADGIHAWTGLSQTQSDGNWTFTDGSKPWSSFFGPFYLLHNHTSCVEIVDNWFIELTNNSGKTQPTFCFLMQKALCKYCPAPPALKVEKAHPRSNQLGFEPVPCSSNPSSTAKPTVQKVPTTVPITTKVTPKPITLSNILPITKVSTKSPSTATLPTRPTVGHLPLISANATTTPVTKSSTTRSPTPKNTVTPPARPSPSTSLPPTSSTQRVQFQPSPAGSPVAHGCR